MFKCEFVLPVGFPRDDAEVIFFFNPAEIFRFLNAEKSVTEQKGQTNFQKGKHLHMLFFKLMFVFGSIHNLWGREP